MQRGERSGRGQQASVAERETEAQQAGVEVRDLGPEEDHDKPERGLGEDQRWAGMANLAAPPSSPALSATTSNVASSSIALARWMMMTQGGKRA